MPTEPTPLPTVEEHVHSIRRGHTPSVVLRAEARQRTRDTAIREQALLDGARRALRGGAAHLASLGDETSQDGMVIASAIIERLSRLDPDRLRALLEAKP